MGHEAKININQSETRYLSEQNLTHPVFLPATLAALRTRWLFFAKGIGVYALLAYAKLHQVLLNNLGTLITKRYIILICTALIAMPLNNDTHA
jgi:hypothetical protein